MRFSTHDAVEIVPHRLYWAQAAELPKETLKYHFFSTDNSLTFQPFFEDFGPLHLGMVCTYCRFLEDKLKDTRLEGKTIVHCCSSAGPLRTNAACLMGAYQVVVMGRRPEHALWPFQDIDPPLMAYRDPSWGPVRFNVSVLEVLRALQAAVDRQWFDWRHFDVEAYESLAQLENGDMNWIIPGKILVFAEPYTTPLDSDGDRVFTPRDYARVFKDAGIGLVVRTNRPRYDRQPFLDAGIRHVDLYVPDGESPSEEVVASFLHAVEAKPGAVAVHCRAGLGRACTLVGLYAMRHFALPARTFIAWCRLCRPGSIIGWQQQYLVAMEEEEETFKGKLCVSLHQAELGEARREVVKSQPVTAAFEKPGRQGHGHQTPSEHPAQDAVRAKCGHDSGCTAELGQQGWERQFTEETQVPESNALEECGRQVSNASQLSSDSSWGEKSKKAPGAAQDPDRPALSRGASQESLAAQEAARGFGGDICRGGPGLGVPGGPSNGLKGFCA